MIEQPGFGQAALKLRAMPHINFLKIQLQVQK
jgi:hypothetical protein